MTPVGVKPAERRLAEDSFCALVMTLPAIIRYRPGVVTHGRSWFGNKTHAVRSCRFPNTGRQLRNDFGHMAVVTIRSSRTRLVIRVIYYPPAQVLMTPHAIVVAGVRRVEHPRAGGKFIVVRIVTVIAANLGLLVTFGFDERSKQHADALWLSIGVSFHGGYGSVWT